MKRIIEDCPRELLPFATSVVAMPLPPVDGSELTAVAYRPERDVAAISFSPDFAAAMDLVSLAIVEVTSLVVDAVVPRLAAEEKKLLNPTRSLRELQEMAFDIAMEIEPTSLLTQVLDVLRAIRRGDQDVLSMSSRFASSVSEGGDHTSYKIAGANFVLAHELGHHLLNHTTNNSAVRRTPAPSLLRDWLTDLDFGLPQTSNSSHAREYEADAMAVFIASKQNHRRNPPTADIDSRARILAPGSVVWSMALLLLDESWSGGFDEPSESHPSLFHRARFQIELQGHVFQPLSDPPPVDPRLGRTSDGHTNGHLLQLWLCANVLVVLIQRGL